MENIKLALDSLKNNKTLVQKIKNDMILVVTTNAIVLRTLRGGSERNLTEFVLAAKIGGQIIGNSSRLETASYLTRDAETAYQLPLQDMIPMIPFGAMKQAGLSLKDYKELDNGGEETVYVNAEMHRINKATFDKQYANKRNAKFESKPTQWDKDAGNASWQDARHFTGARLFSVGNETFLMDIDRNEIVHGIFNPFMVKLVKPVTNIADAYASLKPSQVIDAEKQGLDVKRQGEWFFIPTNVIPLGNTERMALRAGQNRPNMVDHGMNIDGIAYVKGNISHSGREHKDIELVEWHIAIPNTSTTSWQLNGDID